MTAALSYVSPLLGLVGIVLGGWLGARWADRRDSRRLEGERIAAERRAEHERIAVRTAWTREQRFAVHEEVLREIRQIRVRLAPLARGQQVPEGDELLRPLLLLRSRLDLVVSTKAVVAFERLVATIQEVLVGRPVRMLGPGKCSELLDVDLNIRAYVEWARLDLDQEVDQSDMSDRWLAEQRLAARRAVAELDAREAEAATVAAMRC